MQPSATKSELRAALRKARAQIPLSEKRAAARRAATHALRLIESKRACHVAIYRTMGSELDTTPLLAGLRARIYLPRMRGGQMRFAPRRAAKKLDVILLPLLGFDASGTRLGQGGGHYDRALSFTRAFRRPLFIGYAYAAQQTETLPRDPHDVRLDGVITEKGLQWLTG